MCMPPRHINWNINGLTVVAVAVALWRYNLGRTGAASPRLAV